MGEQTEISWTDATWNPWRGCTKVSEGCDYCYMFRDQTRYGRTPEVVLRAAPATFNAPLKWERKRDPRTNGGVTPDAPHRVFTCSWSDFFHPDADVWRPEAWQIIRDTPHLTYQILTKRPNRIRYSLPADWGDGYPNVWLGTSVERDGLGYRAMQLGRVPARVRFLSCEPLLGPLTSLSWWLGKGRIKWVIVGGESGGPAERALVEHCPARHPVNETDNLMQNLIRAVCPECSGTGWRPKPDALEWVRTIRDYCEALDVAFFFKQWGGPRPTSGGDLLDGRQWHEFPDVPRVSSSARPLVEVG